MLYNDVANYIHKNSPEVTVTDLSQKFHISADHMNRVFKKEFGYTLNQYITLMKICNFERLIGSGECLKNACIMAGFGNYSNFIRTYKKYRGHTPGQYVKNQIDSKII